jgi:hypothetical protein
MIGHHCGTLVTQLCFIDNQKYTGFPMDGALVGAAG